MMTKQVRYEALVKALHGDLYRYAYWLCHEKQVAEDLVQETFLRAWRALDSLKDEKAAKSWLITILRRENARRFERKRFDMSEYEEASITDTKSVTTEQELENHWLREKISQLPPEYSEPLILQVLGGFSGEDIAAMLDLNKNTVMTRLFRARNQLKEALEAEPVKRGMYNG
ncbi:MULTISPECIES: sigma-70 family RNA polymerase sigma factor [Colwellia]|uniref:RNA polymerase sigma factor n=2 Tax=Colwellia TaxID=28228 RepID=A0A5C6QFH2_9GAMM|nr:MULTISPECIES: sigma-70 family RNA polymerase sigma factor [Colwellia]AAZ25420.1 RNA polymerase sigma-70 factor, ECF subfamily [Colwellia psychrerythraea 34H]PKH87136.1 RNA polymerase subunit sigma [Colwellia sp. Bg11-28]TWX67784.1 sigma-70 family RNA polymerase sigma factor [Colwellia demingiae]